MRHVPPSQAFRGRVGCDNEESYAYGLETAYDDYCEEYEEKEERE